VDVTIHPIRLGISRSYVVRAEGAILIDGGAPNQARALARGLQRIGLPPSEIRLLVITHAHWDHVGSAAAIRRLTGAPIAVHHREQDWLETASMPHPPGVTTWGRVVAALVRLVLPLLRVPPAPADVVIEDEGLSLREFGVPGRVVHTPGHSPGSASVLLDTGDALVGDLAVNLRALRWRPGLPIFAGNLDQVRASWRRLLDLGATRVYPAHGNPFPAEVMRRLVA
jgi:glyoxylase-like metal-dependent hydrolase (beta-lactamase superfamily II)